MAPTGDKRVSRIAWVFGLGFLAFGILLLGVLLASPSSSPWVAVLPIGEGVVMTYWGRRFSSGERNPNRRETALLSVALLVPVFAFVAALAALH